jgi:hypothetical protein
MKNNVLFYMVQEEGLGHVVKDVEDSKIPTKRGIEICI